jgi:hypothetical protein
MKSLFQVRIFSVIIILSMLLSAVGMPVQSALAAPEDILQYRQNALVLVNSQSADYVTGFQHLIQPYLDHFGIPYTVLDISTTEITENINEYALLIIGHRNLDSGTSHYINSSEDGYISGAVNTGTGLVNFDNDLSADHSTGRYPFINTIFTFGYNTETSGSNVTFADPTTNYIIQNHTSGQTITTSPDYLMSLAGITLPGDVTQLASSGAQPFLAVTSYGSGRAVQFGSYDWISNNVKGPLFGLDDLFWRSMVWAARKPFVMQGLPPFVTMRMDDVSGPLWWIHDAHDYGFVPWAGIFTNDIDTDEAVDLAGLVADGKATTAIHAFGNGTSRFFYFDHNNSQNFDDATVASNFAEATQWFSAHNISIAKYATPHYYEIGSNVFGNLQTWGTTYISTTMDPGQLEASAPWMMAGPFRKYETGVAYDRTKNIYYADYMTIPGHPEFDNKFFNCTTEIRDVTGYEWLADNRTSVSQATADGTEWLKRPLDSMAIATLFSHEYTFINTVSEPAWRQIMQGITTNIAGYKPMYVSMDYACAYARAIHDSNVTSSIYNPSSKSVSVNLAGQTDMPTKFYVFSEQDGQILGRLVDVPTFDGVKQIDYTLPGPLDHITITPGSATVIAGATRQFTAQGFDAHNTAIPDLVFNWSVVNGGGTISNAGLFTAGITPGTFSNTIRASLGSIQATASIEVIGTTLDHFSFDTINSPKFAGMPFSVTIRALDTANIPVVTYNGSATVSASVGSVSPASITFTNGVWTGSITLSTQGTGVTLNLHDGIIATGTSNSFNVDQMRTCPCSIWNDSIIPELPNDSDGHSIEVGMRFQVDTDGYITGLRFYKGSFNTGSNIGHLWSNTGTLLAEATFVGESSSGWQEVTFVTPVAVKAGTTYVASYFSNGYYANNNGPYFTAANIAAYANPPVHGMTDGVDGGNGVYKDDISGFPDSTFEQSNYWVDVVFDTIIRPDTTAPQVVSVLPANLAANVSPLATLSATFDEPLDPNSVNASTVELHVGNTLVPVTVTYTNPNQTVTLDPSQVLAASTTYTATVKGGTAGIKDVAGNALATDISWSFTTSAPIPVPPDEGPGGPILVIADASNMNNPFGRYYAEILRAEGFNAYSVTDISKVTAATLNAYDVVLLSEMSLSSTQIDMLDAWVTSGGSLIAFRPDSSLAELYGLTNVAGSTTSEGYLAVNTSTSIGQGIVSDSIQFHGTADHYTLSGATSLATMYSDATTPTAYPAIASAARGSGHVVIFTFDLAHSIVLMRQGNPAWASQEGDGEIGIRATDMFVGRGGQPNWIDNSKLLIPQADEQMHVLSHAIEQLNATKLLMPRLWYFPNGQKGALIMTGDSDDCDGACIDPTIQDINNHGGTYTTYLLGTQATSGQVSGWLAAGNSVAPHYDDTGEAASPTYAGMDTVYTTTTQNFVDAYAVAPRSVRNHWILWTGWADQAKIEAAHGIGLDANYYHWGSWLGGPGYFTGSGLPMRFADESGNTLNIFQSVTQLPDERWFQDIAAAFKTLIDASIDQGYYGFLNANFHPANYAEYKTAADSMMDYANSRGVPIWSAEKLLDFLQARNQARTENILWDGTNLSFNFDAVSPYNGLTLMIPALAGSKNLKSITTGGNSVSFTIETIKGYTYALFTASTGSYTALYEQDLLPPTVTSVSPVSGAIEVGLASTLTATFSEPMNVATLNASNFELRDAADQLVLATISHNANMLTATLTPNTALLPGTQYTARLRGGSGGMSDVAGNPLSVDYVWSFTTSVVTNNCPCSIWSPASGGGTPLTDPNPIELGLKFRSSEAGYITGIRFYKGATEATSYTGNLYTLTGTLLATVTFSNTTATGWQEANFSTAVPISANTTYVASYFSQSGDYVATDGAFAIAGVSKAPLSALANGEDGSNGVYHDGSAGFPTTTSNSTNYWVDVLFNTVLPSDTTAPNLSAVVAIPSSDGTALITWTTDEPASSHIEYGVTQDALIQNVSSETLKTSHSLLLTGLIADTTYYYRVTSADAANNSATWPLTANSPAFFATPAVDVTPPVISSVNAIPGTIMSATISWHTDEQSNSRVDYGLASDALLMSVSSTGLVTEHTLTLTGLAPNTTYYYRVTSADVLNNSATSPDITLPAAMFITSSSGSFTDTLTIDFNAGSFDSCIIDASIGDGAIRLAAAVDEDFSGTGLPGGWSSSAWTGGTSTVNAGQITVDGALAATNQYFAAGSVVEFTATFRSDTFQNIGFGQTLTSTSGQDWALFGTGMSTTQLYARTNIDGVTLDTLIPGSWLGAAHRYRIEWNPNNILFYVDNLLVYTANITIVQNMRPLISDYQSNSAGVSVDWLRMTPYSSSCNFTSRVFDTGAPANWGSILWNGSEPADTHLALSYRIGNTPTPDSSWTTYLSVANSGAALAGNSRYIQYHVNLTTSDPIQTPSLNSLAIYYIVGNDLTPPIVIGRSPIPIDTGVNVNSNITVTFNELIAEASLTNSSFQVRILGTSSEIAATVTLAGNIATLDPAEDLTPQTIYQVNVAGSVADLSGNHLGTGDTWTFTTGSLASKVTDTSIADFNQGFLENCAVDATIGDGALKLPVTMDENFSGTGLPGDWTSTAWSGGGGTTVGGGVLTVNGAIAATNNFYGAGRSLEFVATIGAAANQHIGFGVDMNGTNLWAVFSTKDSTESLTARINNNGDISEYLIPGNWLGSSHRYNIDWNPTNVVFSIDGTIVYTAAVAIISNMRPVVSDYSDSAPGLSVDWMSMTPYVSPCTFTSRVIDAGGPATWDTMDLTGSLPSGSEIVPSYRIGTSPDLSSLPWIPISGSTPATLDGIGQYIQYQALLSTSAPTLTPTLESVTFSYHFTPTAANLYTFRAQKTQAGIQLTWTVLPDSSTAGFNLYRRVGSGQFILANVSLIPIELGDPFMHTYTFLDSEGLPGQSYEYRLDIIDTSIRVSSSILLSYWAYSISLPIVVR